MAIDVVMPKMGESITEGTIIEWKKNVGDSIERDETLLEISTDKVDSEVPSPESGVISEILFEVNQTVEVGTVIARLGGKGENQSTPAETKKPEPKKEVVLPEETIAVELSKNSNILKSDSKRFYSPLVKAIAKDKNISIPI